jgi:hypothetical protein
MKESFIIENPISISFQDMTNDIKLLAFINDLFPKVSDAHINRYKKRIIKIFNTNFPNEREGFSKLLEFFTEVEKSKTIGGKDYISFEVEGEKVNEALR